MPHKTKPTIDYLFLLAIGLLVIIGLVMLWSASTPEANQNFGSTSYYFVHQLLYGVGIGSAVMLIASRIDYHVWQKFIPLALGASLLALILVKFPGIGFSAGGATRWIDLGPIFFQPSEVAKLALILYMAGWTATRGNHRGFYHSVLPPLIITGLFSVLILWQPDLGTTLSLTAIALVMFFVGGIQLKYFFGIIAAGFLALITLIKLEPYRASRITAFLDPTHDPLGITYQINQAILAVGSGGWFGYGYTLSRQKNYYLPEAISDSIFAVTAEELGFIRVLLILVLFIFLIIRGIGISLHAPDTFGKMLAIGIIAGIGANTIINIGAITGLLPLTGIPLPFFSYGSSAMIVTLTGLGIMLNISKQAKA